MIVSHKVDSNWTVKRRLRHPSFASQIHVRMPYVCHCHLEMMRRNNVDSMMEEKQSGFITTSLITYIGSLLNSPLTVSGFIRGVDKYSPNTTLDVDSIRKFHVTVVHPLSSSFLERELWFLYHNGSLFHHVLSVLEPNQSRNTGVSVCSQCLQPHFVRHG